MSLYDLQRQWDRDGEAARTRAIVADLAAADLPLLPPLLVALAVVLWLAWVMLP